MSGNNSENLIQKLTEELSRLLNYVESTKSGLGYIEDTVMVGSETVPQASVQISAVTGDLESAANIIMSILEEVLAEHDRNHALLESLSAWASGLNEEDREEGVAIISEIKQITEKTKLPIMDFIRNMSCHALAGQKLKKVNLSLSVVQSKLHDIATTFGIKDFETKAKTTAPGNFNGIVNDPMDQDVVDRLLKELGT